MAAGGRRAGQHGRSDELDGQGARGQSQDEDCRAQQIGLLGGLDVEWRGGAAVDLGAKKARALLAYLALNPGRPEKMVGPRGAVAGCRRREGTQAL
jgi:hypothetical protein